MTWKIELTVAARRDLRGLDQDLVHHILKRLKAIQDDPLRAMKRLKSRDDWSLRVGPWRVLCEVHHVVSTVYVVRIQHRSVAYE